MIIRQAVVPACDPGVGCAPARTHVAQCAPHDHLDQPAPHLGPAVHRATRITKLESQVVPEARPMHRWAIHDGLRVPNGHRMHTAARRHGTAARRHGGTAAAPWAEKHCFFNAPEPDHSNTFCYTPEPQSIKTNLTRCKPRQRRADFGGAGLACRARWYGTSGVNVNGTASKT